PATAASAAVAGGCRPPGRTERTMTTTEQYVSVRYIVDDVAAAVDFYTTRLGFSVGTSAMPAFADVRRGRLRLLLSGPGSSGARATPQDATAPGRNRVQLVVADVAVEAEIGRAHV